MKWFRRGDEPDLDRYRLRKRWARRLSWILYGLVLAVMLSGVGAGVYIYSRYIKDMPDFTAIKEYRPPVITRIHARDGRLMGEFYAERRIEVPYSRLPRHLILAFVAAEDARFFEHPGVDIFGIIRAFFRNLEAGEIVQGGSTITQQLVKRILLTSEKSFSRKIREAVLAYQIDNYLSKEEILTLYLNHIFLGRGAYGVEAAAQEFFSKHVEDLTLAEAALLAGIPKAPSRYSPFLNPKQSRERQAYVLRRMAEVGFITKEQLQAALRQTIRLKSMRPDWLKECGYFTEHVRTLLENRFGREQVVNLGLKVYTSADVGLHRLAQEAIKEGVEGLVQRNGYRGPMKRVKGKAMVAFQERQIRFYRKYPPRRGQLAYALVAAGDKRQQGLHLRLGEHQGVLDGVAEEGSGRSRARARSSYGSLQAGDVIQVRLTRHDRKTNLWHAELEPAPLVQAALFSMNFKTGRVMAVMGGRDFNDSNFNRAIQAKRQAGSAFKPIIYAAAIEKGYGPNSILQDSPLSLPGGRAGAAWTPQNYDHSFSGPITLASALARSRNVPAVRMMLALGVPATLQMAKTLGITSPIYPNYSSALGASEVTLMELSRAYSVFPNRGYLVEPVFIERIEDRDGRVLYEASTQRKLVMTPESADIMTHLLQGVVQHGTGTRVRVLKRPIGGKTGTTNRTKDAWFIGFTPSVISGIWVGMDTEKSLGPRETGSQAAAPIFIRYMQEALKGQPVEDFPTVSRTLLAKGGGPVGRGDEEATDDEDFYPENTPLSEHSPKKPSSTQKFLKDDLEG
ncbi:MAG: PBP1A family penicillin-binding protein [Deltaproteobacteria bacterium]|nr:PBP1A family penicillin-binding protein [Deltaproteobacteria bacterium]